MKTALLLSSLVSAMASSSVYMDSKNTFYTTSLTQTSNSAALASLCDPAVKSTSGYFNIDAATKKNYFYWFFESRNAPSTDPVVLWLTGGPGCSSELALLVENGPCSIPAGAKSGTTPTSNPYSWNSFANLLYVDQPAGTGFSTANQSGYDSNEAEVSTDLYHFLIEFIKSNPQFASNDFFITGESYAGHYVPATSHRVWLGNKNKESPTVINLKGMAVGNGLTDPEIQYNYYPEMAYNFTMKLTGKPAIDLSTYEDMESGLPSCIKQIAACQSNTEECEAAENSCNNLILGPYEQTGLNVYNVREKCTVPGLCYDFTAVTDFLNLASTKSALGVSPSLKWESCNYQVNGMFGKDWMKDFNNQIPDLLASDMIVLIYAGDLDFICNWIGNKQWTLALDWDGKSGFSTASDNAWVVNGKQAGELRSFKNFHFLRVFEAGHMVPMDQPANALEMLRQFLSKNLH